MKKDREWITGPYGHNSWVLDKNLYPEGHPYSWQVIGEMEDLFNATVEDVKEFHATFYRPNNATLVVAGDIDVEETTTTGGKVFRGNSRRSSHAGHGTPCWSPWMRLKNFTTKTILPKPPGLPWPGPQ